MGNSSEKRSKTETTKLVEDRLAQATNDETLSALEEDKKDTGSASSGAGRAPAPDGTPAPDEGGGRADGSDTGGPM